MGPTRRVLLSLLDDWHVPVLLDDFIAAAKEGAAREVASAAGNSSGGSVGLVARFALLLRYYTSMPLHQYTGRFLRPTEASARRTERIAHLQRVCYQGSTSPSFISQQRQQQQEGEGEGEAGAVTGDLGSSSGKMETGQGDVNGHANALSASAWRDVAFATTRAVTWPLVLSLLRVLSDDDLISLAGRLGIMGQQEGAYWRARGAAGDAGTGDGILSSSPARRRVYALVREAFGLAGPVDGRVTATAAAAVPALAAGAAGAGAAGGAAGAAGAGGAGGGGGVGGQAFGTAADGLMSLTLAPTEAELFDPSHPHFPPYARDPSSFSSLSAAGGGAGGGGSTGGRVVAAASTTNRPLPLPRLNTAFLCLSDYLYRNFLLFRLESSYDIRADIMEAVCLMSPMQAAGAVGWAGASKMAAPCLGGVSIEEVSCLCVLVCLYVYMY